MIGDVRRLIYGLRPPDARPARARRLAPRSRNAGVLARNLRHDRRSELDAAAPRRSRGRRLLDRPGGTDERQAARTCPNTATSASPSSRPRCDSRSPTTATASRTDPRYRAPHDEGACGRGRRHLRDRRREPAAERSSRRRSHGLRSEPLALMSAADPDPHRRRSPALPGGLRALLDSVADTEVVGEAATGEEAVEVALALTPDVVVMDINMPGLNGIDATRASSTRRRTSTCS